MRKFFLATFILAFFTSLVSADTIIFHSGKRLDVTETWEENGQIKCIMSGAVVGFSKDVIERIEKVQADTEKDENAQPAKLACEGRFLKYGNGIVKDMETGLEWIAASDRDTSWSQAKTWADSLYVNGGGWRMPTLEDLKTLSGSCPKGGGRRHTTPPLQKEYPVWSLNRRGPKAAYRFPFALGWDYWITAGGKGLKFRAFAVRGQN